MRISAAKQEKIKESILQLLFQASPRALFTAQLSRELARDEEYIKKLLLELERSNFVIAVKKSPSGKSYTKRTRWLLAPKVYETYKALNAVHDTRIL